MFKACLKQQSKRLQTSSPMPVRSSSPTALAWGIDFSLPDFRGENGFWNAYPALGNLGISFTQIANPKAFRQHAQLAWGFYGHRLQLYRNTVPHEGFQRLLQLAAQMPLGMRHFTSNVDGQFQKAGFKSEHVTQCHGSIHGNPPIFSRR